MNESPGTLVLHPVALASLALWALNDHVLKSIWPGWFTGKLSDAAGLVVFPLLLLATCELCGARPQRSVTYVAVLAVGATLTGIKTLDSMADGYQWGLAALQWPARALYAQLHSFPAPPLRRVQLARDLTDLWTLPFLAIPLWLTRRTHQPERDAANDSVPGMRGT